MKVCVQIEFELRPQIRRRQQICDASRKGDSVVIEHDLLTRSVSLWPRPKVGYKICVTTAGKMPSLTCHLVTRYVRRYVSICFGRVQWRRCPDEPCSIIKWFEQCLRCKYLCKSFVSCLLSRIDCQSCASFALSCERLVLFCSAD